MWPFNCSPLGPGVKHHKTCGIAGTGAWGKVGKAWASGLTPDIAELNGAAPAAATFGKMSGVFNLRRISVRICEQVKGSNAGSDAGLRKGH